MLTNGFKQLFHITELQRIYPHLNMHELDLLQTKFCRITIQIMHDLQSDLKRQGQFIMIEDSLERIIDKLQTMRHSDFDYEDFYETLIYELTIFGRLQQRNYTSQDDRIEFFNRCIDSMVNYARRYYMTG